MIMYRIVPFHKLKKHVYYIKEEEMYTCGVFYSYDDTKTFALFCSQIDIDYYDLHFISKENPIFIKSVIPSIQQAMEDRALTIILRNITGDETFSW